MCLLGFAFSYCLVCCSTCLLSRSFLVLLTGQKDQNPPAPITQIHPNRRFGNLQIGAGCENPFGSGTRSLRSILACPDSNWSKSWILLPIRYRENSPGFRQTQTSGNLAASFMGRWHEMLLKAGQEKTCVCQCLYLFICVHLRFLRHQRANDWSA